VSVAKLKRELKAVSDTSRTNKLKSYFKTGKGEYGEGDKFLGVTVPLQRKIAAKYNTLNLKDISCLLHEGIHEYRLTALFILVNLYVKQENEDKKREIVFFYLDHIKYINNWDLVDSSAHKILGPYYLDKDKSILYDLARTNHLWSQRTAIITTFYFIKNNHFDDTLRISEILLDHEHDLIHKAVGWMLREIGKISIETEKEFLDKYYKVMPRTMLRYAIEKFPEKLRQGYLEGAKQ